MGLEEWGGPSGFTQSSEEKGDHFPGRLRVRRGVLVCLPAFLKLPGCVWARRLQMPPWAQGLARGSGSCVPSFKSHEPVFASAFVHSGCVFTTFSGLAWPRFRGVCVCILGLRSVPSSGCGVGAGVEEAECVCHCGVGPRRTAWPAWLSEGLRVPGCVGGGWARTPGGRAGGGGEQGRPRGGASRRGLGAGRPGSLTLVKLAAQRRARDAPEPWEGGRTGREGRGRQPWGRRPRGPAAARCRRHRHCRPCGHCPYCCC